MEHQRRSHVLAWILGLLIGVPLFYFLSVPWVEACMYSHDYRRDTWWYNAYITPFYACFSNPTLRPPLDAYWRWTVDITDTRKR